MKKGENGTPLINIIVPVYMVEKYLHRCMDSILAQTFTNFELILVDDGSLDNCGAICDEYAEREQRVIVIHKINNGVSSARNSGLDICASEYVGFVDSDDYLGANWFKELLTPIIDRNADLVSADYQYVSEDENIIYVSNYAKETYTINSSAECINFILNDILSGKIGWAVWMHVFKTEYIFKHHVRFCETCDNYGEDLGFVLEYSLYCRKAVSSDANGYFYVQRNDSIMHTAKDLSKFNRMNELSKSFRSYLISEGGFQELLDLFPVVHYYLLNSEINSFKSYSGLSVMKLRPLLLKNIKDFDFFSEQMKKLRSNKASLSQYSDYQLGVRMSIAEYYADGHKVSFFIKRLLNKFAATE